MNYIDLLPVVICTITGWVSISAFASLVGIPIRVTSSATGLKICVLTAGIKKCKPINKKKKKKHDKILLTAKSEWNSTDVLISNKALIDSSISHDEFLLVNNVLKNFMIWRKKLNKSSDYI